MGNAFGCRAVAIATLAVAAGVMTVGYFVFVPRDPENPIKEILVDLHRRTSPPGAKTIASTDPVLEPTSVRASWEIEVTGDWSSYCQWAQESCSEFKASGPKDGKFHLLKQLPGDTLRLTIEKLADSPLRVRVSFVGYPS